ncbi:MAG: putative nucleic acid-binding Zn-ribbon protein [Rhodothermales bacterium]|jgi:predicted  nucleic acid-binding Zn-ribbon protein
MATISHEASIGEQLQALVRLQAIDSKIDQITKLRGDLPDEIRDMEDEKVGLTTRLDKLEAEQKDHEDGIRQAGVDVKEAELLIQRYEEQQLQVRNNREYDALTKEVEAQKQRITDNNAKVVQLEALAPEHALVVEEARQRLVDLEAQLAEKQNALSEVLADTKHEVDGLEKKRDKAETLVDKRYLRAYKRLRTRVRDGRAVVPLERGAAAGFAVPPQRQLEIRQRNRIIVCEHTGRIIVDGDLFRDTMAEVQAPA